MRTEISGQASGVATLGGAALVVRVFALLALDAPESWPAGWLSVLLGGLLSAPVLVLAGRGAAPRSGPAARSACAMLAVMAIYDAAVSARLFAGMAGYTALHDHPVTALSLPMLAAALAMCLMGVGALTASALIWRRVAAALGLLAALAQAGEIRPGWLVPLLGPGFEIALAGAFRAAGLMTTAALGVTLLGDGPRREGALIAATLVCAGITTLFGMLIPVLPAVPQGRSIRMELLADCGRTGLAAEVAHVLMMSGGMLLTGFELMTGAVALRVCAPRLPIAACVGLCGGAVALLALSAASGERPALRIEAWYYPISLAAAALMAAGRRRTA